MSTIISRLLLNNPDLGAAGGSGLHAQVTAMFAKLGDQMGSRYFQQLSLANAASVDFEHNFKTDIANLRYDLYRIVAGDLVLVTDTTSPSLSQFTIIATPSFTDTKIRVTNGTGSSQDIALVILQDPIKLDELQDVDLTIAPQDGQAIVYEASTGLFKAGASGDASFKLQSIATPNAVLKGGYIQIQEAGPEAQSVKEYGTYDGTGSASTDFGKDLTVSLNTIFGGTPANATVYYLYIDRNAATTLTTQSDVGRKVYQVVEASFVLSTSSPDLMDNKRYIPLAFIKSATSGNAWSGAGAAFGSYAKFRQAVPLARADQPNDLNWVNNPHPVNNTADWATYDDASQVPVDGTGGSPTVTFSRNTTSPLAGRADFLFSKPASNCQGQGVAGLMDVPVGYRMGRKCLATMIIDTTAANYVAGRVKLYVYDITNSVLITPSTPEVPKMKGPWTINWDSTNGAQYRFLWHVDSNDAQAYDLHFTHVILGPGQTSSGAIITGLQSWTPSFFNVAVQSSIFMYQRVGDRIKGYFYWKANSGNAGGTPAKFQIPDGLQHLASPFYPGGSSQPFGAALFFQSGNGGFQSIVAPVFNSPNDNQLLISGLYVAPSTHQYRTVQVGDNNINDEMQGDFDFPIRQWQGQGTVLIGPAPDVEYVWNNDVTATDTSGSGYDYGPQGVEFASFVNAGGTIKEVRFQYPVQATDELLLEVTDAVLNKWIPVAYAGYNARFQPYHIQNSVRYGMALHVLDDYTAVVVFGQYSFEIGSSYGAAGNAWSAIAGTPTYKWRVRKLRQGASVGVELASQSRSGLVAPGDTTQGVVYSDLWNPTPTTVTNNNVLTAQPCMYTRVGKIVTFAGTVIVRPNAPGPMQFKLSLPIPSTFVNDYDIAGVVHGENASYGGRITYDNVTSDMFFDMDTGGVGTFSIRFSGAYIIK